MTSLAKKTGLLEAEVVPARSGDPNLRAAGRNLLSPYDPRKEAERKAASISAPRVRVVGLGLGYLAEALGERLDGVIGVDGEWERFAGARGAAAEALRPRITWCASLEEIDRAVRAAAASGAETAIDPSVEAAPAVADRIRLAAASAAGGGAGAAAGGEGIAERVLRHQRGGAFEAYPPVRVDLVPAPADPRRILVVQPSSIGDVLYTTPALAALRARHPGAWIGYVVDAEGEAVLRAGAPGGGAEDGRALLDEIFVADRDAWIRRKDDALPEVRAFLDRLGGIQADLVVNPHFSARAAWYATVAAAPGGAVLGFSFSPEGVPVLRGNLHHIRSLEVRGDALAGGALLPPPPGLPRSLATAAEIARFFGLGRCAVAPRIPLSEEDRAEAGRFLAAAGLDGAPFAAIHTGSKQAKRRWRRDRWPAVADGLRERLGLAAVWIGGAADAERQAWIRARARHPSADATGLGGLRFTAALLARAAIQVGPDTATTHLAAAVGCPTLTITGPAWVGAAAPRSLVLSGPADPPWCRTLEPGTVVAAAARVLGRGPMPALPAGFGESWTGEAGPTEFLRETRPHRVRSGAEQAATLLSLAWENLVSAASETWGYPAARVAPEEAVEWLGPLDAASRAEITRRLGSLDPRAPVGWWADFFRPLRFARGLDAAGAATLARETSAFLSAAREAREEP